MQGYRSFKFFKTVTFTMVVLLSILILVFSFTGCESKEKIIKIGNLASLSGDDNFFGLDQLASIRLAVSELSPVKIGGYDYKIDIVSKDDEGNAEKAFLISQEFVEENVSAVIGPIFNGTTKASIPVFSEYNIPMITPSAQGVDISRGFPNFFRMIINNSQKIENIAGFISEGLNPSKLILIDDGEDYSVQLVDFLLEIFDSRNLDYNKRYSVEFDEEQYNILAENLIIDEPDIIFFCGKYNEVADLIEKVRVLGLGSTFVTEELGMDEGISKLTDKTYLEGLLAIVSEPPSLAKYSEDKKAIEFWRKYNDFIEKTGENELIDQGPGPFAPYTYDALNIIIDSMKKTNSVLPEDFLEVLKTTSYDGIVGHIEFNSNGDRMDPPSTVFLMKNGDWVRY